MRVGNMFLDAYFDGLFGMEGKFSKLKKVFLVELNQHEQKIKDIIAEEEASFGRTLVKIGRYSLFSNGIEKFKKAADDVQGNKLSGQASLFKLDAFVLWDTYGFPMDLTQLMAEERGLEVDVEGFNIAMDEARRKARNARNQFLLLRRPRLRHLSRRPEEVSLRDRPTVRFNIDGRLVFGRFREEDLLKLGVDELQIDL
ncbi:Alanine--tRNA ligase [Acorus gramineus]|uniref:Alanine--tRNA ligase n=1 Tax=Acorus gramineus TaxID=55184 RepID=A0AAV9A0V0_ACOGR|nr:Alanine--tRNA ligase [Acorus gramineus]